MLAFFQFSRFTIISVQVFVLRVALFSELIFGNLKYLSHDLILTIL